MEKWYRITNKNKTAEIDIYGEIGWEVTANQFGKDLKALGNKDQIDVYINSPGGDVFDGVAVYNMLKRNKATITTNVDGMALSIASVIFMAGDVLTMAENAMLMVHNPWGFAMGDAADMRKMADTLEKVKDSTIIPAYETKAVAAEYSFSDLMDDETWLGAEEAKLYFNIDDITEEQKMAAFDLSKYKYRNIPALIAGYIEREKEDKAKEPDPRIEAWKRRIAVR